MELTMMLIALMEFAYIIDIPELCSRFYEYLAIYADDEFGSLLLCNFIRFFFNCLCGKQVSYKP